MNKQPPRRPRGANGSRAVNNAITRRLRELDLSGERGWKLSKRNGLTDPPPYNNWTTYSRRVRLVFTTPAAGTSDIDAPTLYAAAGVSVVVFPHMTYTNISVYGQTTGGVLLQPRIVNQFNSVGLDREFSDFGVPNARRAVVHASISERDQGWYGGTGTGILLQVSCLSPDTGLPVAGGLILDVTVKFRGTATAMRLGTKEEPEPWDSNIDPEQLARFYESEEAI